VDWSAMGRRLAVRVNPGRQAPCALLLMGSTSD
jgi:hypothetical protein